MMVLIKTVSKTNSPLFCLTVITKIITTLEKRFFCRCRKDFGSKLYLFPCKNYSFWGLLFSVFWFVKRHSFKPHALHFQLNYECDVIFTVPQMCAYFVDNPHNLEIDSFKIAVSEHILLYFKNSNSFFCVHMIMCGTRCVKLSWLVVYFRFRQVNIPHTSIGYVYSFIF
jgi:hypothetical protein